MILSIYPFSSASTYPDLGGDNQYKNFLILNSIDHKWYKSDITHWFLLFQSIIYVAAIFSAKN